MTSQTEKRLIAMQVEFASDPTDARRAEYRREWEAWLAERGGGKPVTYATLRGDELPKRPREVPHAEDPDGQLTL